MVYIKSCDRLDRPLSNIEIYNLGQLLGVNLVKEFEHIRGVLTWWKTENLDIGIEILLAKSENFVPSWEFTKQVIHRAVEQKFETNNNGETVITYYLMVRDGAVL